jgi:preprotein translocase subunit YajC
MFVSPAYAQAAAPGGAASFASTLPMLFIIFGIMYFLMIRPQQKKMKEHRAMVAGLKVGDKIVTQGGVFARVTKVKEDDAELEVEIATGVKIRIVRSTVVQVLSKTDTVAKS